MLEFKCTHCGASIIADDDQRSHAVTCENCNTRVRVPGDAASLPDFETLSFAASRENAPSAPQPPQYALANFIGVVLIIVGFIECGVSVILAFAQSPAMLLGIIAGLALMGFGVLLHLCRELAIDVWHIRQKQQITP